ncbi:MAG: hypothetical protein AAF533_24780 [Acidobacteriota bacterium]
MTVSRTLHSHLRVSTWLALAFAVVTTSAFAAVPCGVIINPHDEDPLEFEPLILDTGFLPTQGGTGQAPTIVHARSCAYPTKRPRLGAAVNSCEDATGPKCPTEWTVTGSCPPASWEDGLVVTDSSYDQQTGLVLVEFRLQYHVPDGVNAGIHLSMKSLTGPDTRTTGWLDFGSTGPYCACSPQSLAVLPSQVYFVQMTIVEGVYENGDPAPAGTMVEGETENFWLMVSGNSAQLTPDAGFGLPPFQ